MILVADDSNFFRTQVKTFVEEAGHIALVAEDGELAFQALEDHADEVRLVLTDIEMPNLDGFGLAEKIRGDGRFDALPIVAITSMAGEVNETRSREAGIDQYMIKLDRDRIVAAIDHYLEHGRGPGV